MRLNKKIYILTFTYAVKMKILKKIWKVLKREMVKGWTRKYTKYFVQHNQSVRKVIKIKLIYVF